MTPSQEAREYPPLPRPFECWEVLASGYRKVHGRTDRQMVMQILALLAAAPAPDSTRGTP